MGINFTPRHTCGDCRGAKRFLAEQKVQFDEIHLDQDRRPSEIVMRATGGKRQVPTFEIHGRMLTSSPFDQRKFAEALGIEL